MCNSQWQVLLALGGYFLLYLHPWWLDHITPSATQEALRQSLVVRHGPWYFLVQNISTSFTVVIICLLLEVTPLELITCFVVASSQRYINSACFLSNCTTLSTHRFGLQLELWYDSFFFTCTTLSQGNGAQEKGRGHTPNRCDSLVTVLECVEYLVRYHLQVYYHHVVTE